ncbi:MAG: hypothetical protein AAGF20_00400 [Pseudomonadota bacterium]
MGDRRTGLGAAIDDAREGIDDDQPGETGDLFGGLQLEQSPFAVGKNGCTPNLKRGRGRPKNSRNRRTQEMIDFLLTRHRDPLIAGFDVMAMGPAGVAAAFLADDAGQVTNENMRFALEWWRKVWSETLGYIHTRQPLAVKVEETKALEITLGNFGQSSQQVMADALAALGDMSGLSPDLRETILAQVSAVASGQATGHMGLSESAMITEASSVADAEVLESKVLEEGESSNDTEG